MASPVAMGDILAGKYKVERVIGHGGMGVVVAAMHEQLEQRVALKFLLPQGADDSESVGRFLREARAAVRLRSEHVARVLDVGTMDNGSPYIVMEYLEGRDLASLLDDGDPISLAAAATYILQAAEAVAEAHAAGIIHRDLKPANLFLTRKNDGTPFIKVLDFGIAKTAKIATVESLTKTSTVMGTPFYMSPEQLRSSRSADARSDIWALGMILYELLTGSVAFVDQTLPGLCAAILTDPLPSPRLARPDIPDEIEVALTRALEKDPAKRFQNLAEFAAALAPFATDGPAGAVRVARILGVATPMVDNLETLRVPPPRESAPSLPDEASATLQSVEEPHHPEVEPEPEDFAPPMHSPARRFVPLAIAISLALLGTGIWLVTKTETHAPPKPRDVAPIVASASNLVVVPAASSAPPEVEPPAESAVIVSPAAPSATTTKHGATHATQVSTGSPKSSFGGRK